MGRRACDTAMGSTLMRNSGVPADSQAGSLPVPWNGTPIRGTGSCESCSPSAASGAVQENHHEEATVTCYGSVACRDDGQCSDHRDNDGRGARGGSDRAAVSDQDQEL